MDRGQDVAVLEFDSEDRLERGIVLSLAALKSGKPRLYQFASLDPDDAKFTSAWRSRLAYNGPIERRSMPGSAESWAHDSTLRFDVTATHNPRKVNEIRRSLDYSLSSREGVLWELLDHAEEPS